MFIALNMIVIAGSLAMGLYFYNIAQRYIARDVIYIAPRLNEGHLHFSRANVDDLAHRYPGLIISAESRGSVLVASSTQSVAATAIYVDTQYFAIHSFEFIEGGHWHGAGVNAIVLNQAMAWRLFGSISDIAGLSVWIRERLYIVTGVVLQGNESRYMVWMPVSSSPPGLPVTALYIQPVAYNPLAVYAARDMVGRLGRMPGDYAIVDMNRFIESINIRTRLLLYAVWLCMLIFLMRVTWRRMHAYKGIKVVKNLALPLLGIAVCLYTLWGINDILMWLPNLSNPNTSLFESITAAGVLPPEGYLPYNLTQLSQISRYGNYVLIAGLIAFINLLFCQRLTYDERGN